MKFGPNPPHLTSIILPIFFSIKYEKLTIGDDARYPSL